MRDRNFEGGGLKGLGFRVYPEKALGTGNRNESVEMRNCDVDYYMNIGSNLGIFAMESEEMG